MRRRRPLFGLAAGTVRWRSKAVACARTSGRGESTDGWSWGCRQPAQSSQMAPLVLAHSVVLTCKRPGLAPPGPATVNSVGTWVKSQVRSPARTCAVTDNEHATTRARQPAGPSRIKAFACPLRLYIQAPVVRAREKRNAPRVRQPELPACLRRIGPFARLKS